MCIRDRVIDAYFSATKIRWILDHGKGVRERAERGELCCGTVDSWLVWKLTRGNEFITDITNASRTMLFNIHTQEWDKELLDLFQRGCPKSRIAPFAIVYFGKKYYLTVAKTKHYSNG